MAAAASGLFVVSFVADHQWAQVTRVRSTCVHDEVVEGVSTGYKGDHGMPGYDFFPAAANATSVWPYGCWYWMDVPSDIFVNVGRSMRFENRYHAHLYLGIPCNTTASRDCDTVPGDKLYCTLALRRGYQSIQVRHAHPFRAGDAPVEARHRSFHSELLSCSTPCTSRPLKTTCPGEEKLVDGNRRPCECSEGSGILNCDGNTSGGRIEMNKAKRALQGDVCASANEKLRSMMTAVEPLLAANPHCMSLSAAGKEALRASSRMSGALTRHKPLSRDG